jgi:formyltetrahydrofolate deformylase
MEFGLSQSPVHLLVSCPDARGLIAAITGFLSSHRANVLDLDQHTDSSEGWFFARVAFDPGECDVGLDRLMEMWGQEAMRHRMSWRMHDTRQRRRVAILAGTRDHCLRELLWRCEDGELDCEVGLVISNHDDLRSLVERFGVAFHHLPVTSETRSDQERSILSLLGEQGIDLVVLARYMQVLSPAVVREYPNRILNIHHSFLPAFAGSKPYHQAFDRGVKVIGATCHYVTEVLDDGPIVEQSVVPVNHRDTLDDLIRKGSDLERSALVTGVRLHLQDRVLVHGRRTIVFH